MVPAKKAKKPAASAKSPGRSSVRISHEDLSKPASYLRDGTELATLAQVIDPKTPTLNLVELDGERVRELVIRRLELAPDTYRAAMIGVGILDKHRAIAEVRAGSRIGQYLVEIERYVLDALIEAAAIPPTKRRKR